MTVSDCIFCRIVRRELPATIVAESESALAFRDLDPRAPQHVLVIPKEHVRSLHAMAAENGSGAIGQLFAWATEVATDLGIAESGYRVITNVGDEGGQSVHHLHLHLLGGAPLGWTPA